jgi:hypothetical protein
MEKNYIMKIFCMVITLTILLILPSCSDKRKPVTAPPNEPPDPGHISGAIYSHNDSTPISNANIVIYDANKNAPVTRAFTDSNGNFTFLLAYGTYYLEVGAQGYYPVPVEYETPIPFKIESNDTVWKAVYLYVNPGAGSLGSISGYIMESDTAGVSGVLVVATGGSDMVTTSSGSDGYYVFYNMDPGPYTLECYRAGFEQDARTVTTTVYTDSAASGVEIYMDPITGAAISGQITFLASNNWSVDITLIHPEIGEAVPGLTAFNDTAGGTYSLKAVPPGTYIAWASYRNDGYVTDPWRIAQHGIDTIVVTDTTTSLELDFWVTGAISIVSPTNHADTVVPREIHTTKPTFSWLKYPSTKEYILEVKNERGEIIWGGFDENGVVRHTQVTFHDTSTVFNFDGSATDSLHVGGIYKWKVYSDNDDALNVQMLLSSSEDLLGLFKIIDDN